jgi:pilus assembly protein CpaE
MGSDSQVRARIDSSGVGNYPRAQTNATIVLICPDENHRRTLTRALEAQHSTIAASLTEYPGYNDLLSLVEKNFDAVIVEADSDADNALIVVETICARKPRATVMVYSGSNRPDLLMSAMRAGAREFLSGAIAPNILVDALLRAAARQAESTERNAQGRSFMFWGAKGGSGVTTLATNFAIALRKESGAAVALVDLNPQLGDVSVLLGLTPEFTLTDALSNPERLDDDFISMIVSEHRSGISVIAASDAYDSSSVLEDRTVGRLVELLENRFSYVVIDAGPGLGKTADPVFQLADTIFLVSQADIPSLHKAQRFITYLKKFNGPHVELVLNRFEPRKMEFDEESLSKAVGMPPKWKVPNDYTAARRAANSGIPLIGEKSTISQTLTQMARAACGKRETEKKTGFSLFR